MADEQKYPQPWDSADPQDYRTKISSFLTGILGGGSDEHKYGKPIESTRVVTKNNASPYESPDLQDDPQMELAVTYLQHEYPQLFKGIANVWVGAQMPNDGYGAYTRKDFDGGASIFLRHSGGDINSAFDTLRHELSHVAGLPDVGTPSAYDVGLASSKLHQDIYLPKDRK